MNYSNLRTKKISVVPVKREGGWLKGNHDGAFMFTGAHANLVTPFRLGGNMLLVDPLEDLSVAEKESLAKELSVKLEDLNVNNKETNIFYKHRVSLDKSVKVLNLTNPWEFIDYCVLKSNKELVAPSDKVKLERPSYRWALVDPELQVQETAKLTASKMDAVIKLADYKGSVDKLTNLLTVAGISVPKNATADWLFSEAYKIADSNPSKFLELTADKDFDIKLIINKAIEKKVIVKVGKEYAIEGGSTIGSKDELISYLSSPEHTKELAFIKAKI
jgi:hypothetical protein